MPPSRSRPRKKERASRSSPACSRYFLFYLRPRDLKVDWLDCELRLLRFVVDLLITFGTTLGVVVVVDFFTVVLVLVVDLLTVVFVLVVVVFLTVGNWLVWVCTGLLVVGLITFRVVGSSGFTVFGALVVVFFGSTVTGPVTFFGSMLVGVFGTVLPVWVGGVVTTFLGSIVG